MRREFEVCDASQWRRNREETAVLSSPIRTFPRIMPKCTCFVNMLTYNVTDRAHARTRQ